MKIEIIQEKFAQSLVHINKAIASRPNIPVLANVLIQTEKGELKLSSTDLEIGITAKIGADIEKEGEITVSAKLLSEFVNTIKPGKISLELKDNKLVVKSVDNSAEFFVIPADDFPSVPVAKGSPILKIDAGDFVKAVDKTSFSASSDNSRPVLTGLLTIINEKELTLVGVDGFRLSEKKMKIEKGPKEEYKEIIPAKTLNEIAKIIRDVATEKDKLEIYSMKGNNQVIFKIGNIELASRLIEGEFPNYKDILPKEKNYIFNILKQDFADALKVVSIFARNVIGNKTRFKINSTDNKLQLSAFVNEVGKNDTNADITNVEGGDIETAYNARFMQDMLNSMEGDEIVYETASVTSPGVFLDKDDTEYIHVIMPMRLE